MSERIIDLRSDTVTLPTGAMYQAMLSAPLGDDVYGDDPTVNRLEEVGAKMVGKEAGLFVPSGTMGNLLGVMANTQPGEQAVLDSQSHIYYYEAGGLSRIAGLLAWPVATEKGWPAPEVLAAADRGENIHFPRISLLCLENTHNRAGGAVISEEQTKASCDHAHARGWRVHLDGARLFHAAVALDLDIARLTAPVDTVMFCLSKGLAAPVGSLLAGDGETIAKARRYRKLLGGGMRQAGILAAAGLVALEEMTERLAADHLLARQLAGLLAALPGAKAPPPETNIVMFHLPEGIDEKDYLTMLAKSGLLCNSFGPGVLRFVTHYHLTQADIEEAAAICSILLESFGCETSTKGKDNNFNLKPGQKGSPTV
ncbi:MAG: low specificity L-threonine aldolase [Clostridiales bacterium]|jgi:threonine aldolase|nr:low specificity L-threonine aldolase [Clostridiales bacterium]